MDEGIWNLSPCCESDVLQRINGSSLGRATSIYPLLTLFTVSAQNKRVINSKYLFACFACRISQQVFVCNVLRWMLHKSFGSFHFRLYWLESKRMVRWHTFDIGTDLCCILFQEFFSISDVGNTYSIVMAWCGQFVELSVFISSTQPFLLNLQFFFLSESE